MRNASVAGAEAGCQAEVGAASAMAACCCDRTDGWNTGDVSAGSSYGDLKPAWYGL